MTSNLQVNQKKNFIDSLEVADMIGKRHDNLLRDIDNYMNVFLTNSIMRASDYFEKAVYFDLKGEQRRKYLFTRKGCELVANKMTGEKGILFTVAYIDRFHEMEKAVQQPALPTTYKEALLQLVEQVEVTERLQAQLEEQAPAIEYHDKVIGIQGFKTVSEIAKELGLRSAQELYQRLIKKNVIFYSRKGSYLHRPNYTYLMTDKHINYKPLERGKVQLMISQSGKRELARLLGIIEQ
ncbi:Rha family transcriptional regulator [Bacillus cereus]|nr:rha family phage regulatory protein [Bacillus cereus BAG3X2-1]PET97843.1 Rha family transcriptional regulator [Bacillus cereus]PFE68198.1 Rha family transcriptional regulator [Bacillus cereus]PFJ03699.1 Rha family transcriptional regulator [Bacillus cereus]PGL38960.1 Rha family transcriptional regulator [Bacillus cereus]